MHTKLMFLGGGFFTQKGEVRLKNDSVAHLGVPHCRKCLIKSLLGALLTLFQISDF
jgi:hypothetical protein